MDDLCAGTTTCALLLLEDTKAARWSLVGSKWIASFKKKLCIVTPPFGTTQIIRRGDHPSIIWYHLASRYIAACIHTLCVTVLQTIPNYKRTQQTTIPIPRFYTNTNTVLINGKDAKPRIQDKVGATHLFFAMEVVGVVVARVCGGVFVWRQSRII